MEIGNSAPRRLAGRGGWNRFFTEGTGPAAELAVAEPSGPNSSACGPSGPDASAFATRPLGERCVAAEFQQVKSLGRATGSTRTADQTAMAQFWADHAVASGTGSSARSRSTSSSRSRTTPGFAMLYLTGSDALIVCLQDKGGTRSGGRRPRSNSRTSTGTRPRWRIRLDVLAREPAVSASPGPYYAAPALVRTLRDYFGTDQVSFGATRAPSP